MSKKTVAVLEIGSSKLKVLVTSQGVNDTFIIKSQAESEYDGYFQGAFVNFDNFKQTLRKLFGSIDCNKRQFNRKIYVGLPAEFTSVTTAQVSMNFNRLKKIKQYDLDNLFMSACDKVATEDNDIVSISPISYELDDDGIDILDPVGKKASILTANVSIIIANKELISSFNEIFFDLGFERIEYLSEVLSEAQAIIPKDERENLCLLIDCGHLSTSVSFVEGDGILETKTFSVGGGHITGDLSEIFELTFRDAEKLKNQVVLSLKGSMNDKYTFVTEEGIERKLSLNEANNAVAYRVEEIGQMVEQTVREVPSNIVRHIPIYIVGSGLISIKGGKNLLAKYLGKNIVEGLLPYPGKDKQEFSAMYSLALFALKKCK